MTINIDGIIFDGPYPATSSLRDYLGVYIIWKRKNNTDNYSYLYVGQSGKVRTRVDNHDKKDCWSGYTNQPYYSVYYTNNKNEVERIEKMIISRKNPPCNKE
ncbi:MAG: hypothetical protein ACXAD7_08890 [Candidatus Kariarchaeaceae archaeon]|jgi:hypothetical protein